MDSDTICRLCLGQDRVLVSLFSDAMERSEMLAKIERFFYFEVKETDVFSKFICIECVNKIEEFHNYCVEVEDNQHKIAALQSCTQYELIIDECTTIHQVAKQFIGVQPYDISVRVDDELCSVQPINDLGLTERDIENSVPANYEIMVVDSSQESIAQNGEVIDEQMRNEDTDSISVCSTNDSNDEEEDDNYDPTYDWHKIVKGFPKVFIKDAKLVIRGRELFQLMSKFYKLNCEMCPEKNITFTKITDLLEHYDESHSKQGFVKCCGLTLSKTRSMALHMARHVQPEAFRCPECGKMLTCPKILQYHIQNHLPEEKRRLACPKCPRRFSYSSALVAHSVSHLPEQERDSHICDECGKAFLTSSRLSTHISNAHTRESSRYVCHECGRRFSCKGNLSYHLTTHEEIHQVQCVICQKWLKNKLCLRKHMSQHSEVRHQCPLCNYSSVNVQCFRNHIRIQHSNNKPHVCNVCGKGFKLKNTLENHLVQHTGEKKYSCEYCPKKFASSGNYYAHRKRMHYNQLLENNQKREQEKERKREEAFRKAKVSR